MDHAITLWDAAIWLGIPLLLFLVALGLLGIVSLLNPFRSGH